MSAPPPTTPEERQIVKAAGQIGFYTLLSRITGLFRDIAIGAVFGAGFVTDTFFTAFRIPNMLRRVVGEGASAAALVPVITEYRERRTQNETIAMIRSLLGIGMLLLFVLSAAGVIWATPIASFLVPGFSPEKLTLTAHQLRIMFPCLFFIGLSAIAMGVLHAYLHFAAPAFAPIFLNISMISATLFVGWFSPAEVRAPILILAGAVVIGGLAQLLWHVPVLQHLNVLVTPEWNPRHPAIRQIGRLLVPVLFSSLLYQVSLIVKNLLASLLSEGSVSALWYATRVFDFPQGIFVLALSSAALPSLAAQTQRGDLVGVRDSLGFAMRLINFVVLPAAVGLTVLSLPICVVLFFHGAFTEEAVRDTAQALRWMVLGLWSVAAARLLTSCLYALQDTRTPLVAAVLAFVTSIFFGVMFMGHIVAAENSGRVVQFFAALSDWITIRNLEAGGLALSASLAATVNVLLLGAILLRRLDGFPWVPWLHSLAWSILGAVVMIGPVWWIQQQIDWFDRSVPYLLRVGVLLSAIVAGIVSFTLVAWWGGKTEFAALLKMLPDRLLRRVPQFLKASN
ncbi:MAG: murein biosynthesis integral membrane protein MurJ [Deltaproteobacteria bacterium]|nr:murein biosynthesis integral membrane protein MurJ [Deltaproteobacteria bacterium]